ncbi:HD domain-containing protein [Haploplasma axanthum]|nr:HD domain-containing protein [Haploplasma axanthum]
MEEKIKLIAKIDNANQGQHFCNITVLDKNKKAFNIKLDRDVLSSLVIGKAYVFEVSKTMKEEKEVLNFENAKLIEDVLTDKELNELLPLFYNYAPISHKELKKGIEDHLNKIENKKIKAITLELYEKYKNEFYLHSAATKFHHAYVGGLAHHTLTMLKLATPFTEVYRYLNKDLLYAGIILHDMAKIDEITGADGEYTVEGQLLGHLVMIALEIEKVASKLGIEKSEEVLLLKHIVVSHHGLLNFGSPKKPQTGEALLIWFLDTIDSKFTPLGEAYKETNEGEFTNLLQVMDRMKFYKNKI